MKKLLLILCMLSNISFAELSNDEQLAKAHTDLDKHHASMLRIKADQEARKSWPSIYIQASQPTEYRFGNADRAKCVEREIAKHTTTAGIKQKCNLDNSTDCFGFFSNEKGMSQQYIPNNIRTKEDWFNTFVIANNIHGWKVCQVKNGVAVRTGGKRSSRMFGTGGNKIICDWDHPAEPSNPELEYDQAAEWK